VTVLGNAGDLAYAGYSFVGWQTKADGSGTTYRAGGTFAMGSANTTLYALWAGGYAYAVNWSDSNVSQYTIARMGRSPPCSRRGLYRRVRSPIPHGRPLGQVLVRQQL